MQQKKSSYPDELWCDKAVQSLPEFPELELYSKRTDEYSNKLKLLTSLKPFSTDVPTVVCVCRNDLSCLKRFLPHYLSLGAKSIHIIDNASEDGSSEFAATFPQVTVWRAVGSYSKAAYGQMWVGAIARRFGLGKWILNVDADELLVYSSMGSKSLADLQELLERLGMDRLVAPLIDLYAQNLSDSSEDSVGGLFSPPQSPAYREAPYMDRFGSSYFYEDTVFGLQLRGGIRWRLSRERNQKEGPCLNKVPLARWTASTAYANVHFPSPHTPADIKPCAALMHLKLAQGFAARIGALLLENQHWRNSTEYRSYEQWFLNDDPTEMFSEAYSTVYTGVDKLLSEQIISRLGWSS